MKRLYRERYDLRLGPPLGFSNDYVWRFPASAPARRVSPRFRPRARAGGSAVAGYPFFERADGFRGMLDYYGFESPPETVQVDLDMVWQVIGVGERGHRRREFHRRQDRQLDLVVLEDDRAWFPPYESAVVYRPDAVPAVGALADRLGGALDGETMRALNRRVDLDGERPAEVAADFIARSGLSGWSPP